MCWQSRFGVAFNVMKNCELFELLPEFAWSGGGDRAEGRGKEKEGKEGGGVQV